MFIDSESDESSLNIKHVKHRKLSKLLKPYKWVSDTVMLSTSEQWDITFKLTEFSTSK